jgi:uncharacterized protein (DUF1697 family)
VDGIIAGNSLAKLATDPSRLLVAMVSDASTLAALKSIEDPEWGAERVHVGKHAAYVWCANGILESKALGVVLKRLEMTGTTRNWATLTRIHALLCADGKKA